MEKIFLSLIKTRCSVRAYKSEPVPSKALDVTGKPPVPSLNP